MAHRVRHSDGPEYGWQLDLSDAEYRAVVQALSTALERAVRDMESPDDSIGARAATEEYDLSHLIRDLDPMLDD